MKKIIAVLLALCLALGLAACGTFETRSYSYVIDDDGGSVKANNSDIGSEASGGFFITDKPLMKITYDIEKGSMFIRAIGAGESGYIFDMELSGSGSLETMLSRGEYRLETGVLSAPCDGEVTISFEKGIDYLVLVNKTHPLPDGWEDALETVHMTNSCGDDVEIETKAYDAYLKLKAELEKEGVYVDLDSARRSVAAQQDIMDRFIEKYGEEYAKNTVATPGYSEHHTGLALDLYLNVDGKDIIYNEDLVQYPEIWAKIHEKLADCGFILRFPEGKEDITGYSYEPWHIRYIDNVELAKEITAKGITLEEYLENAHKLFPALKSNGQVM